MGRRIYVALVNDVAYFDERRADAGRTEVSRNSAAEGG